MAPRTLNYSRRDDLTPWQVFLRMAELIVVCAAAGLFAIDLTITLIVTALNTNLPGIFEEPAAACSVLAVLAALLGIPLSAISLYQLRRRRSAVYLLLCVVTLVGYFLLTGLRLGLLL